MTADVVVVAGSYAAADAPGIRAFGLDLTSGTFVDLGGWPGVPDPSFLAMAPGGNRLYAVSEVGGADHPAGGRIHCFDVDWRRGRPRLRAAGSAASAGDFPCHLGLDPLGRWIAVANFGSGAVTVVELGEDGRLGASASSVRHVGHGPDPARQDGPHAHSATPTVDGRYIVVDDLGTDRVVVYEVDDRGALHHRADGAVAPGAGPRHTAMHPDGGLLVVANELDSTVTTYVIDRATGALERRDTASTLSDAVPSNLVADVHFGADGRRLHVSNRGHDSVATFELAPDGALARTGLDPCGGHWPRSFLVLPDGGHLVVANERSDELVVLPTTATGVGAPIASVSMPSPTCVVAVDPRA